MLALPLKYRDVVYLHDYENYTAPEISRVMGKNVNTVYTLLTRAKQLLREKLVSWMRDRLKQAFDAVHAEEALKERTKAFVAQQTRGHARRRPALRPSLAAAFACLCLLFTGGYWLYFTPTATISIDINPSIELGVNRFNRVVSVEGYNAV